MALALFADEAEAMREYEAYMRRLYPRRFAGLKLAEWRWVPEKWTLSAWLRCCGENT